MKDEEIEKIRKNKIEQINRKINDPRTKAKEFSQAIVECDEYKNFIKFDEELQRNQSAQKLLKDFQQKQMELQMGGFNPNTLEELKELQMEIRNNEAIQNFAKSQQELVDVLRRSNDIISAKIGQQFAQGRRGGCC